MLSHLLVAAAIDVLVTVPFPGGHMPILTDCTQAHCAGRVVRLYTTQIEVRGHTALRSRHPV